MLTKLFSDKLYVRQETFDEFRRGLDQRLDSIDRQQTKQTGELGKIVKHLSRMEGHICMITPDSDNE